MKVLWLASWYPSEIAPFNGDFIQRHARAASLYHDIHVLHVAGDVSGSVNKQNNEHTKRYGRFTEQVIYFRRSSSLWGRFRAGYRSLKLYRQAIRKYIRENGEPDMVHVQVPMQAGIAALWVKKKFGIPFVVTEHWGIYNDLVEDSYATRSYLFRRYTKDILAESDAFTSVSKYLAEAVNKRVGRKQYRVIPNVANSDLFFYKEKDASHAKFRFIHVSNMASLKNVHGILRAYKMLLEKNKNTELVIVGDTDPGIRDYAASQQLNGHIGFRGEISYANVAAEMQASDCLVLFSNIENSPCVIGEAFSCGLPVIATRTGGIPELVDAQQGILVNPGDEAAMAHAMQQVIENYANYDRRKLAENAHRRFSYPVVGKQLSEVYEAVLASKSSPKKKERFRIIRQRKH